MKTPEEEEGFRQALGAMGAGESAHFLVRIRDHALRFDGTYERLLWGLALAQLWRYKEALSILTSRKTSSQIERCRRTWMLTEGEAYALPAAAGIEAKRCDFLGNLYTQKGQLRHAVNWYGRALGWLETKFRWSSGRGERATAAKARLRLEMGERLWRQGSWREARGHVRYAMLTDPDPDGRQEARYALGLIYRSEGMYARAARCFKEVGATEELEDIHQARAMPSNPTREQLLELEGPVSWIVGSSRYLRAHPEDWEIRIKLCYKWRALYCFKDALAEIRAVERHHGTDLVRIVDEKSGRNLLSLLTAHKAYTYKQQGQYRAAAAWFRRATELEPDIADHWTGQGACEARRGQLGEAEELLRQATRCPEGSLDKAWYNLGLVLRSQERFSEASDCLTLALTINPGNEDADLALIDVCKALDFLSSTSTSSTQ